MIRTQHGPRSVGARAVVVLLAVAVALGVAGTTFAVTRHHAASGATANRSSGLVGYPSWLPKSTLHAPTDKLLTGYVGSPALTNQGDPVRVDTTQWSVLATVRGPEVPGAGLPYQTPATTCTFDVTLSSGSGGAVPIALSDFDTLDSHGIVTQLHFVPGQPRPPAVLAPGSRTTFELRAAENIGEGILRWAPIGGQIVAKWDYVVEND